MSDRKAGIIIGGCVGDIFGSITEGMTSTQIVEKYNGFVEFPLQKLYTDDTEMTIALAIHLIENDGNVDRKMVHEKYASHMTDRAYSSSTRKILTSIRDGNFPDLPGTSTHNGSLMRISPLAFIEKDYQSLIRDISNALYYTHYTPEAVYSSYVHCRTLHALMTDKFTDIRCLFEYIQEKCRVYMPLWEKMNTVKLALLADVDNITYELTGSKNTFQIKAIDCLCCAYYLFFKYGNVPNKCLYMAVTIGGDTDTIGKVLGEILGARYGMKWIPDKWLGIENEQLLMSISEKLGDKLKDTFSS